MSKLQSILRTGSSAINFVDDIKFLTSISEIAERYDEVTEKLGRFTSPEEIVDQIANGNLDNSISDILTSMGLSEELDDVVELVSNIQDFSNENLKPYYNLIKPVTAFDEDAPPASAVVLSGVDDGLINWPIISIGEKLTSDQKDNYAIELELGAELDFEAGDTWPYDSDSMPDPLLRIGFKGSAKAGAKAEIPLKVGFIGGKFDAEAGIDCQYFYDTKKTNGIFAAEIGKRLPRIPDPFNFDDLWSAFSDPQLCLAGIILKYDGDIGFDLEVGLGKKFTFAKGIELDAGLTVKVGVKRPGSFELSMRPGGLAVGGGKTIITTLSRGEVKERVLGFGLGIELDLTGVASRVHTLLSDALGYWDKGLEQIKPYLSPGTWIQENLYAQLSSLVDELIKDQKLREALSDDLQFVIGIESKEDSALKKWLTNEIVEKADNISTLATAKADSVGKDIATHIANELPTIVGTDLQKPINDLIGKLLMQFNEAFDKTISSLAEKSDKIELAEAFRKLGDKTSEPIAKLDDLGSRVEALLNRYDKLFRKVVKATGDGANAKISAAIEIEDKLIKKSSYQFSGEFLECNEGTRRIFKAMMRGKFQQAAEILTEQTDGFVLNKEKSRITRFRQHTNKFGYSLILFGLGNRGQKLIDGVTAVTYTGNGDVDLSSQALGAVTKSRNRDETRSAKFMVANSILISRVLADQPQSENRMMDLGLQFLHEDDKLRRKELDGIVKGLVDIKLVAPETIDKAKTLLDEWVGHGSKSRIRADVDIRLVLDRRGIQNLMQISAQDVDPKLDDGARQQIGKSYRQARTLLYDADDADKNKTKIEKEIGDYQRMIGHMRDIYFSIPAGIPGTENSALQSGWTLKQYDDAEREIEKIAKKKISHLKEIVGEGGFGDRLDRKFLLFMRTLVNLSFGSLTAHPHADQENWSIAVTVTRKLKNGSLITKTLM